jgi:hypothetical protein
MLSNSTINVPTARPKVKSRCGKCGADIELLREMLLEPAWSESFAQAIERLENCSGCKSYFAHQLGGK